MLLRLVGLDPHHYSGHSFRIGGAQSSSIAGLNDYEIKLLGCLSSDYFKRYIRYPLISLLLTVTPRLAKTKDIPYQCLPLPLQNPVLFFLGHLSGSLFCSGLSSLYFLTR